MDLDDFVNKYNGKKVDFDGVYGAQCVDLFRQYCKEGLDIPEHTGSVDGAKDLFLNYPKMEKEKKYFYRYSKTSKGIIAGDVAIWGESKTNKYGHVAIILGKLNNCFIVFEQDGFKQDGAKINLRNKENLLGVLRRK